MPQTQDHSWQNTLPVYQCASGVQDQLEEEKGEEQSHTDHGKVEEQGEGACVVYKQAAAVVAAYEACEDEEKDEDIVVAGWGDVNKETVGEKDVEAKKEDHEQREDIVDAVDENHTAAAAAAAAAVAVNDATSSSSSMSSPGKRSNVTYIKQSPGQVDNPQFFMNHNLPNPSVIVTLTMIINPSKQDKGVSYDNT